MIFAKNSKNRVFWGLLKYWGILPTLTLRIVIAQLSSKDFFWGCNLYVFSGEVRLYMLTLKVCFYVFLISMSNNNSVV